MPRGTDRKIQLLPGTLDLVILKILTLGSNHAWGIAGRIRELSGDGLGASQGALYPALHRMERTGDVASEMVATEKNRRARVYQLTTSGRRSLSEQTTNGQQFASSINRILQSG
jgi:transcriptional regulator